MKIPFMFIIGKKEVETNTINVRTSKETMPWKKLEEFINNAKNFDKLKK